MQNAPATHSMSRNTLLLNLSQRHALPSRTTVLRHRLTLTMASCKRRQDLLEEQIDQGPVVSWGSLDLSPQGGYELVMSGLSVMLQSDLVRAFRLSIELCSDNLSAHDSETRQKELRKLIHFQRNPPTGVGSGRSGLPHKIHAWCHAQKLVSPTWKSVAAVINSFVTLVGDMGEQRVISFRGNLRHMFGDGVQRHDSGDIGVVSSGQGNFDFEDVWNEDAVDEDGAMAIDPNNELEFDAVDIDDIGAMAIDPNNEDSDAVGIDDVANDVGDLGNGDHTSPDYPPFEDPYELDLRRFVYISGLHHVLHNVQEGFVHVLSQWEWFLTRLRHADC